MHFYANVRKRGIFHLLPRNEYYPADLQVAPSQDISKVKIIEAAQVEEDAKAEESPADQSESSMQEAIGQEEEDAAKKKKNKPRRAAHKWDLLVICIKV